MSYLQKIIIAITKDEALDILDIQDDALDLTKLKTAYRKAAMENHPDRGGNEDDMKKVNEAYEYLAKNSGGEGASKVNWDAINAKYRKAGALVVEQLKKEFKPEIFTEYFKKATNKNYTVSYFFKPKEDVKSPSYAGVSAVWTSEDKNTAFSMSTTTDLHEVVWPKGSLGGDDIGYSMWIDTEIFHENRKVKFKKTNWDKTQIKSVLYDPEKTFPSDKIAKMIQGGKDKTRAFSRRDMYLGISKRLDGTTNDQWAYIPLGANKDFKLAMYRSVTLRRADWSPVELRMNKAPHQRWKLSVNYILESEEILDKLADIQNRMKDETDGEKIKSEIEKAFKKEPTMACSYLNKILAADVIDLKPKLKQKKAEDKEKKTEQDQPQWDKAKMRVHVSSAYAGGYELEVTVPVPATFLRDKKADNKGEFITQLHNYINENTGKWLGTPTIGGFNDRAKNGNLTVKASWHFEDAFLAYALGLDLSEWHGSNEVVKENEINERQLLAEKAFKELQGFRDVSHKKLKLRSQDPEERNTIWKEEFMENWVKLTNKWKERGIDYYTLSQSPQSKKQAVGEAMSFLNKVQSHYAIAKNQKVAEEVSNLMASPEFMRALPHFIDAANAGIMTGHKQQKPEMIKFNALSLAFLEAIKAKDVGAANNAGEALVKAGHGAAFGL